MNVTKTPDDERSQQIETCDTIEEQINAFMERFTALAKEAEVFGFTTAIVMASHDLLDKEPQRGYVYAGNFYAAVGAMERTLLEWKMGD